MNMSSKSFPAPAPLTLHLLRNFNYCIKVGWSAAAEGAVLPGSVTGAPSASGGDARSSGGGTGGLVASEDVVLPTQAESWMRTAVQQELLREQMQEQAAAAVQFQHYASAAGAGAIVDMSQQPLLNAQVKGSSSLLFRAPCYSVTRFPVSCLLGSLTNRSFPAGWSLPLHYRVGNLS